MPKNIGRAVTKINSKTLQPSDINNRIPASKGKESAKTDASKAQSRKGKKSTIVPEKDIISKTVKTKGEIKTFQNTKNVLSGLSSKLPKNPLQRSPSETEFRTLQSSNPGSRKCKKRTSSEHDSTKDTKSISRLCRTRNGKQNVSKFKNNEDTVSKIQRDLSNCENNELVKLTKTKKRSYKKKQKSDFLNNEKTLDEIISDLKIGAKERNKMEILDQQINLLVTPQKSCPKSPLKTDLIQNNDASSESQKTIQIIDPNFYQCIYSLKDLEKIRDCLDVETVSNSYKMPLSESVCRMLLSHRTFRNGAHNKKFMSFVFRLLAVHDQNVVVDRCLTYFMDAVECNSIWIPSIHDIVEVLINFGCTAERNCPLLELFRATRKSDVSPRKRKKTNVHNMRYNHCQVLDLYNLAAVFELLTRLADKGLYEDDILAQFVLLLSWLMLDPQTEGICQEMQICLTFCLNAISDISWNSKWVMDLSARLSQLTDNPEDILRISNFLIPVGRSQNLRKIISLRVAHKRLKSPYTFKHFPTPADVVSLLKLKPLLSLLNNVESLDITLGHIECVIGEEVEKSDLASLKELSRMFRSTAGRIVDSIYSPKATQVKSMLLSLACKLSVLQQQFDPDSVSSWKCSTWTDIADYSKQNEITGSLDNTQDPDCVLPSPAKLFPSVLCTKLKNKVIPSYTTKPAVEDNEVTLPNGGNATLNSSQVVNSEMPIRFQKRRSFFVSPEENISSPAKKVVIPSYKTKARELSGSTGKTSECRRITSNGDSPNLRLKNKLGSGQKLQEKHISLESKKRILSSGRRKLNFNNCKDVK